MLVAWVWWKSACRSFDSIFVESEMCAPNMLDGPDCPRCLEHPRSTTAKEFAEVQPNMHAMVRMCQYIEVDVAPCE